MDSVYEKILLAQGGNEPAMLDLVQQFFPLLKKYAYLMQFEDAINELSVDFIELIMTFNLDSLHSHNDGALVNYINNAIRYKYILRNKKKRQEDLVLHWTDLSELAQRKYEPQCSLFTAEEDFMRVIPPNVLSESELNVITMVYLYGYSSAEIARVKGITRQAVNQIKHRALKKLQKALTDKE